jgi:1,2-dihydroxy-3-keto-5-methylthiopentene dioxygenase
MWIQQGEARYTTPETMAPWLEAAGIESGVWPLTRFPEGLCEEASVNKDKHAEILQRVQPELDRVKATHGYQSEDIVALTQDTPNLAGILTMFDKEHHHTDDEVRVILAGEGIFGIVPQARETLSNLETTQPLPPYEIHVEAGDYINVPANTRHWFTLTDSRFIVALRIFSDTAGWTAIYEPLQPVTV